MCYAGSAKVRSQLAVVSFSLTRLCPFTAVPELQQQLVSAANIKLLTTLLKEHSDSAAVEGALARLLSTPQADDFKEYYKALVAAGVCEQFVPMLQRFQDDDEVTSIAEFLAVPFSIEGSKFGTNSLTVSVAHSCECRLTDTAESAAKAAVKAGLIGSLTLLMSKHSDDEDVQAAAISIFAEIIGTIAQYFTVIAQQVLTPTCIADHEKALYKAGVVELIFAALKAFPENLEICTEGLAVLEEFALDHSKNFKSLGWADVKELVKKHHPELYKKSKKVEEWISESSSEDSSGDSSDSSASEADEKPALKSSKGEKKKEAPKFVAPGCKKGHACVWAERDEKWSCDHCKADKTRKASVEHWWCKKCNFDYCLTCVPQAGVLAP